MKPKTKNRQRETGFKAKVKFYFWLVSIGADVRDFNPDNLQIHEIPPRRKSTFKKRVSEIKAKYNHRFKLDHLNDNFLENYPNIESITFERKTA